MLHELHVTGLGIIDDLDLEPHGGLTVLTGETGAGKTMVTVAIGLATGARASAQLIRPGEGTAKVQARFDALPDPDGWVEDGQVILARTVASDGRSGARIGGQLATVKALAELGGRLVEIHAQHHALRLLEPATQTAFLDRAAGPDNLAVVASMAEAYGAWRQAERDLDAVRTNARDREREIDLLRYQVEEISSVGPRQGETAELETEASKLAHVERLIGLAGEAIVCLSADGGGAEASDSAARALTTAAELDPAAGPLAERARGLAAELAELARDVRGYADAAWADPQRLEEVRDRIGQLKLLQRKYGEDDAHVLAYLASASDRLEELTGEGFDIEALQESVAVERTRYDALAGQVRRTREATAPMLAQALTAEVRDLGMPSASVAVTVTPSEASPTGSESVVIELSPGDGQPSRPIGDAVSGGELSRVMLACRSVLADLDDVPTLVFDEVDAGIGGQAGLAVGARLARLASSRQVIVVTHLPQIACFADRHVRVRKHAGTAVVEVLDDGERRLELSRMLAGLEDSAHGASHADELLETASALRSGAPV